MLPLTVRCARTDSYPTVASSDGTYTVNASTHALDWQIPIIDRDSKSGSMEFSCPGSDPDAFFPVSVGFAAEHGLCGVKVRTFLRPAQVCRDTQAYLRAPRCRSRQSAA